MGFNGLEAPCVTAHYSLGYWVVHATNGHAVGYIASSQLCFISVLLVGWLGEPQGLYPACAKYRYRAKMEPCSSVHSLSCHGIVSLSIKSIVVYPVCAPLVSEVFTNERS
jgi:hypothetical protein